jgi:hypothetical protein
MNEIRKIRGGFVGFGEVNTPKEFIVKRCAAAAKMLQGVLDQYKDARPAAIALPVAVPSARGKKAASSVNKVDEAL